MVHQSSSQAVDVDSAEELVGSIELGVSPPFVPSRRLSLAAALPWVMTGVFTLALLLFAIGHGYNHDEEQFVAAAVHALHGELYRDFVYLQTPLYPTLLAGLYGLLGAEAGYFLVARLLTWVLTLGACSLLALEAWRLTRSPMLTVGTALLFASSTIMQAAIDSTRNDMAPCLFGLAGIVLTVRALDMGEGGRRRLAAAGLLLAFAVGMKLSWAFAPLGVMIYVLALDRTRSLRCRLTRTALPLALGGGAGLLLILSYGIGAWPAFLDGNITYHQDSPLLWHSQIGRSSYFETAYLATMLNRRIFTDAVLVICVLLAVTLFAASGRDFGPPVRERLRESRAGLVLLLVGLGLVVSFLPRPPYVQYFVPFAAMLALALPTLAHALVPLCAARRPLLAGVLIIGCLPGSLVLLQMLPTLAKPQKWTVSKVAEASRSIRDQMALYEVRGPVLTLTPILALEAGLETYRELSAGPFFYRTGDRLPPGKVQAMKAVTPSTLEALLARKPPAAVLVGREPDMLEAAFVDYARRQGFIPYRVPRFEEMTLWVRPGRRLPALP